MTVVDFFAEKSYRRPPMQSGQRTRSTAQAVPLEVVRDDETPTEIKAGRKRKLTPAVFEKIMAAIEGDHRSLPPAAVMAFQKERFSCAC
jgi:hypothetical protein